MSWADETGLHLEGFGVSEDLTERRTAEEALARLRGLVEFSDIAIIGIDLDGRIVSWNKTASRIFEIAHDCAIGNPLIILGFSDLPAEFARILENPGTVTRTFDLKRRQRGRSDGSLIELSFQILQIRVRSGQWIGGFLLARDVTKPRDGAVDPTSRPAGDLKLTSGSNCPPLSSLPNPTDWPQFEEDLTDSERLGRSILDSLPYQIAVLDQSGVIIDVNRAWHDHALNREPRVPISRGVNFLNLFKSVPGTPNESNGELASKIRDLLVGLIPSITYEYSCDYLGQRRWFLGRVHPFQGNGPQRAVVSHLDVTDRKNTEKILKRSADRQEILRSIYQVILSARSPEEIARVALKHLGSHIPFSRGRVEAFDFESGEVRVLSTHQAEHSGDERSDNEFRFDLHFPLSHDEQVVGSLEFGSDQPLVFQDEHVQLAREVADQLAITIRQTLLSEEIRVSKNRLELVSRRLIRAEEDLRRQIARELHDEIGQAMTAVKIHLQYAREHRDDQLLVLPQLNDAIALVERTLRQVRSISLDLRPSLLDDFGLTLALRSLLKSQARIGGFSTRLDVIADEPEFRLVSELETACFRIAQESLTNILRHAQARNVTVRLEKNRDRLHLSVIDDGIGFDPDLALENASAGASFGLMGMHERVHLVGGQIEIRSSLEVGTKVSAWFPWEPRASNGREIPHETDPHSFGR